MRQRNATLSGTGEVGAPRSPSGPRDHRWDIVRAALADPQWHFRSVEGIATETRLEPRGVERTLQAHRGETRSILARSRHFHGVRQVHTLASRPRTLREVASDICAFASR